MIPSLCEIIGRATQTIVVALTGYFLQKLVTVHIICI